MKSTFTGSSADALKTAISRQMLSCRTVTVGIADSEPKKNGHVWCIDVLPAIQQIRDIDNERQYVDLPKLTNVPLILPCSNALGLSITMPIRRGDEVVLLISDRSLDNWQLDGGIQRPAEETEIRHHDLSDCLCIPSALTIAALDTYNNDAVQIGSSTVNVTVTPQDVEINAASVTINADSATNINCSDLTVTASGNADITAANTTINSALTTCNGDLTVTGTITGASVVAPSVAAGALSIGGVDLPSDHTHDPGSYTVNVDGTPTPVTGTSGVPQ